jgi:Zn-dependent membrane protease YugP
MLMSLIGAGIIFFGSLLFTSVVFPDYFEEVRRAGQEVLRAQGMSEADIQTYLDQQAAMQTSFMNAIMGVIGTLVTGLIISLIAAAFLRKKAGAVAVPEKPPQQ